MNVVSSSHLLSAGLLASPALAELAGLRGSLKANMAAEEDRAAWRALRDENLFSVPFPEFEELPDIVPGVDATPAPPGGFVTDRADTVTRDRNAGFTSGMENTDFMFELLGDPDAPDGFASSFANMKTAESGMNTESYLQNIDGSFGLGGEFDIDEFVQSNTASMSQFAGEKTTSDFTATFPGEVSGYYYKNNAVMSGQASDAYQESIKADEQGAISNTISEMLSNYQDFADATDSHAYEIEFATSAVPP